MEVSTELLAQFKLTIGDFTNDVSLDAYYTNFLLIAISDLLSDDISEAQLETVLGQALIILTAQNMMNNTDASMTPTIKLLRTKLAAMTKGDRNAT